MNRIGYARKVAWVGVGLAMAALIQPALGRDNVEPKARNPYLGAIVVNADSGAVLFEDQADAVGYPASVLKLMTLLIVLEKVDQGVLKLDDPIQATAEASKMGGSQVYLAENEVFTLDEMLYALMVQSACDVARALSIHIAGSKEAFVQLMNERAQQLGMKASTFHSDHGLPPSGGDLPDVTTARDMALLCQEVLKHPAALKYTSCKEKRFRNETFEMRNHNSLLWTFPGCDGLKTGWYKESGYCIAATAERNGVRVIAIVFGSQDKKIRDQKAAELLTKGFMAVPRPAAPAAAQQGPQE